MSNLESELSYGCKVLKAKDISSFHLDAALLLAHATGMTKTELYTHLDYVIDEDAKTNYHSMLSKRKKYMPIAYILKHCEFMGLEFYVDENVLIPRPDTEVLVEEAIEVAFKSFDDLSVLDMCCGSGCIGISVANHCERAYVTAVDNSKRALDIAYKNACLHSLDGRMNFLLSDMFGRVDGKYNIIVSNPPYIRRGDISKLRPEVKNYEPGSALDGGIDGLDLYRVLARHSGKHLIHGGVLLVEISFDQAEDVAGLLNAHGFANIRIVKDLAGHNRVVKADRP